jgi:uncharacterized membrane protein HdeD (DUF308 family)
MSEQRAPAAESAEVLSPQQVADQVAALRAEAMKGKRRLASSVLAMEVVVFWLAIIVAIVMSHVSPALAVSVGGALALGCIAVAARIKAPWAYRAGWALQVLAVACGLVVHAMFFVGAIFLLLWLAALRTADAAMRVANAYAASVESGARDAPGTGG